MGLGDMFDKGKDLYEQNKDKVDEALHSEQAENMSDQFLDKGADAADNLTGGKYSDKIDGGRESLDGKIGNE